MTEAAFEERITALTQEMYRVTCSLLKNEHDRQDAVQEAIWKAWKNLSRLRDEAMFRAWIMRILVNECKNIWRRKRFEIIADPPDAEWEEDGYARLLRDEALHKAVMELPQKLRLVVILYYIDGFSLKETAHALSIPVGTVKSRLNQAKSKLRVKLEREV